MSKSPVWKFFTVNEKDSDKVICNKCEKEISCKGGVTSPMINHLKLHEEQFKEFENLKKKRGSNNSFDQPKSKQTKLDFVVPKSNEVTQKLLDNAIVNFLAESNSAFRVVDLDSFKDMFKVANNRVSVKSREYYSKLVSQKADEMRHDLQSIVEFLKKDLSSISFTTDLWTSVNGDPFISLTMHFICNNWKLYRVTPYIKPFPERHTGNNISLCLDSMIEELGLEKLDLHLFSVNDNAANMKLGIKMSKYLKEYNCDIHTLERVIKDAIVKTPSMIDVLKKTKDIGKFANKSSVASSELKRSCKNNNLKFKKPVNPPNTRWSGFYKNLASILYLQKPLNDLFIESDSWGEFSLSSNDWKLVEAAVTLLKHFCETVEILQSEAVPTLHRVIERIYTLKENICDFISKSSNNRIGSSFAKELKSQLSRRFPSHGSENKYRRIANYLAPQYKGIHLEACQKYEETKLDISLMIESANSNIDLSQSGDNDTFDEEDHDLSPTSKLKKRFMTKKKATYTEERSTKCPVQKEMSKYEIFSLAPSNVDVLKWWKTHENSLPILASVAKIVLTIPSSSAKSERVFSSAGNIATCRRNKISLKKLEDLVVLKENTKHVVDFKAENASFKLANDGSFDKIQIETNGISLPDESDHDIFCDIDEDDNNSIDESD